jgi:hypothetical protein
MLEAHGRLKESMQVISEDRVLKSHGELHVYKYATLRMRNECTLSVQYVSNDHDSTQECSKDREDSAADVRDVHHCHARSALGAAMLLMLVTVTQQAGVQGAHRKIELHFIVSLPCDSLAAGRSSLLSGLTRRSGILQRRNELL